MTDEEFWRMERERNTRLGRLARLREEERQAARLSLRDVIQDMEVEHGETKEDRSE